MASMTSVISFLILLLATYSYSAPTVTPGYKFTTGTIMVGHRTPANLILLNDKDSVSVPNIHKPRSFDSEESTTFESQKREFDEFSSSTVEPVKREFEESTDESQKREFEESTDESQKREFNEFSSSTVEPIKREFEESTDESEKREFDESTTFESQKRGFSESSEESTTVEPVKREFEEFSSSTIEPVKREFDEFSSSTVEPVKREFEESSSTVEPRKRSFPRYSKPYMETATSFNGRAIGEENVESFDSTTPFYGEQPEGQQHEEPSSSADLEAGQSGLLNTEAPNVYQKYARNPNAELVQTVNLPSGQSIKTTVYKTSKKSEASQKSTEEETSYTTTGIQRPEFIEKH